MDRLQTGEGQRRGPAVWGKVPLRNKNFTGRGELLESLRSKIEESSTTVALHALHGMGGVGKTQMAIEYAWRYQDWYDLIWWVPADQPMMIRSALAQLAPFLDLPQAAATSVGDAAAAVLEALRRGEPYDRWLLIFDNADQPEDINELMPRGPGHVLLTSRNNRWADIVETLSVDVFTREESIEFLHKRVSPSVGPEHADRLAEQLGDLPLALEQAGALLAQTGMAPSDYLEALTRETANLLSVGKPNEYPMSMTAAWSISVTNLDQRMPEAVELLRCCALFGPEPIPRDVFRAGGVRRPQLAELLSRPIQLSQAIGELGRYALVKVDLGSRTVQVHRLIQALVREALPPSEQEEIRADVHQLLVGALPQNPDEASYWEAFRNLVPHLEPTRLETSSNDTVRSMALDMIRYLFLSGDFSSALRYVDRFIEHWSESPEAPGAYALRCLREKGNILRELGDYGEAYALNQSTLEQMRAAGLAKDDTFPLINSIGADLRASGRFREALAHDEESWTAHVEAFGLEDPRTLRATNNLAVDNSLNSRFPDSIRLHEQAFSLADQAGRTMGAAFLLATWNGLARATRLNGEYGQACDVGEEAFAYGIDYLGHDHPWTLRTQRDLAIALRRFGELERAEELAYDVHNRCVDLFGLDQPDTLASAMSLANVRRNAKRAQEGLELAADTVQRYRRIYGREHPYTLACAGNHALLLRLITSPQEARDLNECTLAALETVVGKDHHYYLTVATNLASDHAELRDFERAVAIGESTVPRLRRLLRGDHPMTLACAGNLSADLRMLGRSEDAERLAAETEAAYGRTLPHDHPDVRAFKEHRHLDLDFDPPPI
ncbi:tetratricopeptide repeat protein [Actinomadura pelletieri DSM 43383]|uniref:Tetratricopeptide repeat protein n=1 Tax=Actinomadura pelletieri DSM 43383 TaxID=1120940 RepID=A0A495QKR4_9ACTN|nr:FxSxx-COOH system tetratricopeptide repeat protein [Actinomadura pelletieri]RKS73170.1 tetratricopeptide repeat protein [Actinomadura pelletieri DSM 43383]